jgi:hypothetical protein
LIGIVLIVLGESLIYRHRAKSLNSFESSELPSGENAYGNNSDKRINNRSGGSSRGKKNTLGGSLAPLTVEGASPVSSKETDTFTDDFNQWLSTISLRDDVMKPFKAIKLFQSLSDEYDHLTTIQGKVVLRVDGGEPVFSGDYYVQLEDGVPATLRADPWQYNIRVSDSENGLNILLSSQKLGVITGL